MKFSIIATLMIVGGSYTAAQAEIYGGADQLKFRNTNGSIKVAEFIPCEGQKVLAKLPPQNSAINPLAHYLSWEKREGLQRYRASLSFLRSFGLENPDCIKIVIQGNSRNRLADIIEKAEREILYTLEGAKRQWRRDNYDQLRRQELNSAINNVKVVNKRRPNTYCTGNQFLDFEVETRLWSLKEATAEFFNRSYIEMIFAVNAKDEDMVKVSNGYGCRYLGETLSLEDLKRGGEFKDVNTLSPKIEDIVF